MIDCERGSENYTSLFKKSGSVLMQSNDCDEIIEEIRNLGSEKHDFKTVVIDPITTLEADLIAKAEKKYGGDMRMWGERDRYFRRLFNLLIALDMNVIVTAHGKTDYGPNMVKLGQTFDGWKRLPYLFDLVVELQKQASKRVGFVKKTRLDSFKDGESFEFSYEEIKRRYGANTLERQIEPTKLAAPERIKELRGMAELLKVDQETIDKWLDKANVAQLEDLPADKAEKLIEMLNKQIEKARGKEVASV